MINYLESVIFEIGATQSFFKCMNSHENNHPAPSTDSSQLTMSQTMTSTHTKTTTVVRNQPLDVADLEVIQLEKLIAKDPAESAKLFKAAGSEGFFYVAFDSGLSEKISAYLQSCYHDSHEFFSKPLDEKMKAFREGVDYGYVSSMSPVVAARLTGIGIATRKRASNHSK